MTATIRRSGAALLSATLLLWPLLGPSEARAQSMDMSNAQFWVQERALQQHERPPRSPHAVIYQRPTHLLRRAKPVRGFAVSRPETPPRPAVAVAPATAPTAAPANKVPQGRPASIPATLQAKAFEVSVIGDPLARSLQQGLADLDANRPELSIVDHASDGAGLASATASQTIQAAKELASGKQRLDLAIIMLGSNDRQPIREGAASYEPLTPKWRTVYQARAEALAEVFHDRKIPFVWVGAPIMRSAQLSEAMLALNDIFKAAAQKEGGVYLDTWDLFSDDSGQFAFYGPDVDGDTARLRAGDGVSFTKAGARKLAQLVDAEIKRVMDGERPKTDEAIAGAAPQIAPAAPLVRPVTAEADTSGKSKRAPGDLRGLVPIPAAPIQPVIPIRPSSGPVVALTAPVVAPGGQLVTRALVQSSALGESSEQALANGAPIQPQPGRADDFRWPRD